jgi:hypothetical protein
MKNTPNVTATMLRWLSEERLGKLIAVTGDLEAAIELHQATLRLGSYLMTIVATIEISLRNAVSENLSAHFAVNNWLSQPPIMLQWREPELNKLKQAVDSAKRSEYAKLSQAEKSSLDGLAYPLGVRTNNSHLKRSKDRRKQLKISEGKIVAELTFYFWKRLYGPDYEQSLWRTTLKRTFPFKKLNRSDIAIQLERIYQARNRLAHHEPVLHGRLTETIEAINFVAEHLGEYLPNKSSPLAGLISKDMDILITFSNELHAKLAMHKN